MKTIIAGGRYRSLSCADLRYLDSIAHTITKVVHGACPSGVDQAADRWAHEKGLPVKRFPAEWGKYGLRAGPIRNAQMAEYAHGGQCILFPGGKGTASMHQEATRAGLTIIDRRSL